MQGRTAYGGLSAALCYEVASRVAEDLPPLRSAQFAFIGPAICELRLTPTLLRRGKSAAFYGVDMVCDAGVAARALLYFGAERPSEQNFLDIPTSDVPNWGDSRDFFNRRAHRALHSISGVVWRVVKHPAPQMLIQICGSGWPTPTTAFLTH